MPIRGAIDQQNGNSTRYCSVPGHSDFDFPDSDWCWLVSWAPNANGTEYVLSCHASYGITNSMNLWTYSNSNGVSVRMSSIAEAVSGTATVADKPIITAVQRIDGEIHGDTVGINDPDSLISLSILRAISGTQPNTGGVEIGRRQGGTSTRYMDGRWFGAAYFPGISIRQSELLEIATGRPLKSFPWYSRCVFHAAPLNSVEPQFTDLTGRHVITVNGSGYGSREYDETVMQLEEPRDLNRIYRPLYGTPPPVSGDVLVRGVSGISHGVVASAGGGYSGLHSIDSGFIGIEGEVS